jgi:hypothetical protein
MSKPVIDVSYYVKKKGGFPSVGDQGVADILLGGQGFSFKMKLSTTEKKDRKHFFKIDKVDVNIKHLNIKLKQSNHKMLFGLFKPLLFRLARPAIQKVLEKQIKDSVHQLDGILFQIHQEAEKARRQVSDGPGNVPNIYSRYYSATRDILLQGKEKTNEVAASQKVNVAVTQHDSIFKNINLPGGISSKATEYRELAAKGEKWESPVFSIGSATESVDIPKVSPTARKHHDVRQRGLRETNTNASAGTGNFSSQVDQVRDSNIQQSRSYGSGDGRALGTDGSGFNGNPYTSGEKSDPSPNQGYHNALSGLTG